MVFRLIIWIYLCYWAIKVEFRENEGFFVASTSENFKFYEFCMVQWLCDKILLKCFLEHVSLSIFHLVNIFESQVTIIKVSNAIFQFLQFFWYAEKQPKSIFCKKINIFPLKSFLFSIEMVFRPIIWIYLCY